MKEAANPYAPPAGEPSAPSPEDWAGRLWRVEEGRLLVKDRASLPNVCIHGGASEEGGSRCSLQIYGLSWRRRLLVLLSAGGLAAFSIAEGFGWGPALLIAWLLQEVLGRKIRVMVFRCPAERRKSTARIIGLFGIAGLLSWFFARSPGYLEELVVPAVILALLVAAWSISPPLHRPGGRLVPHAGDRAGGPCAGGGDPEPYPGPAGKTDAEEPRKKSPHVTARGRLLSWLP